MQVFQIVAFDFCTETLSNLVSKLSLLISYFRNSLIFYLFYHSLKKKNKPVALQFQEESSLKPFASNFNFFFIDYLDKTKLKIFFLAIACSGLKIYDLSKGFLSNEITQCKMRNPFLFSVFVF